MDGVILLSAAVQYLVNYRNWLTVLSTVISFFVLKRVLWKPFKLYVLAQYLPGVQLRSKGQWAVVTGATDGIGKAYARALAGKGLDIVLISRSDEKLDKVKQGIVNDYKRAVRTIQVDFSHTDIYERIQQELEGLEIGILVNNVGTSQKFVAFQELANLEAMTEELFRVNCISALKMTSLVLPRMAVRDKGVIVNISSVLAYLANGNVSVYSATKSFILNLTNSIRLSYKKKPGIIIQTLTPGATSTNMLQEFFPDADEESRRKIGVLPERLVSYAINTIGWENTCDGHPFHWFIGLVLTMADYL